jgi:hypothetical protein
VVYVTIYIYIYIYIIKFRSLMSYSIVWGNSFHSSTIFLLQKKVIIIILGHGNRTSCINIFRELGILMLASQYIFSLLMFVVQNITNFPSNLDCCTIVTRQKTNSVFSSSQPNYLWEASLLCRYKDFQQIAYWG